MNALDLSQAVFIQNQQIKTDSLKVANAFGKRHTNVLRAIENLDCPKHFTELNFELSEYIDSTGRVLPKYEMTKDGWMFLVMGFTGEKAAQIKIAFIQAFNAMAALLYNRQHTEQGIQIGAKVQLKSGSPELTVNQLIYNTEGYLQAAEVIWFKNRIYKETLSIQSLIPVTEYHNAQLQQFWNTLNQYGLHKLNHARSAQTIALNLTQACEQVQGIPHIKQLAELLIHSKPPYPQYLQRSAVVKSQLENKSVRCWLFHTETLAIQSIEQGGAA